jgi:beta-N-acetylhexosaminidase
VRHVRFFRLLLALLALTSAGWSSVPPPALQADANDVLDELTPAQRVGQLFLVTVDGTSLDAESPLLQLLKRGAVSGVLLSAENNNFPLQTASPGATQALIASLQEAAVSASSPEDPEAGGALVRVPLLVGVRVNADGIPWSERLQEYPDVPSQMAIGATWDPDLAREVGRELGSRFQRLGINLLLGPSLDVLGDPRLGGPSDLGVATFGGDPFWVGVLGKAMVEGIHAGSGGGVGVIVTHFPGLGGSDRAAAQDVATVRRTLDQLQGFELQPFAAVAAATPGTSAGAADGMLTAHIRFQGLQGNIRVSTQPVSLDAEAFEQLTATEPIASWRSGGGLMVSDSLGSKAIRRFMDPSEVSFPASIVARDAFLAGNDLLLLEDFRAAADPDEWATIRRTLDYFTQRYQDDPVFAQRVDEAALRVLSLKLRLFGGSFGPPTGGAAAADGGRDGQSSGVGLRVARAAATLVSPNLEEMRARLGTGPQLEDRIVIFTDSRRAKACTTCTPLPGVDSQAFEKAVLSLYGGGNAQVRSWNLTSFSTADLAAYLGEMPPTDPSRPIARADDVAAALKTADWVVFLVERERPEEFGSDALRLLLNTRPDLFTGRKLVVFALDVPYDLDATDISKVDALYALYSRGQVYLDVAARLLFQELPASGSLPVSVPAIGYDLIKALSPDPGQIIDLSVGLPSETAGTPGPVGFRVNDMVSITTGVLLDSNGHAVPDGTPVEFSLGYPGELPATIKAGTQDGMASISATLARLGLLSIAAQSEPARSSNVVQLNVQENMPAFVTVIAPTAVPTIKVGPAGDTPTPDGGGMIPAGESGGHGVGFGALLAGVVGATGLAVLAYYRTGTGGRAIARGRLGLMVLVASLFGYNYVALGFPGAAAVLGALGVWAPGVIGVTMGLVVWGGVQLWLAVVRGRESSD